MREAIIDLNTGEGQTSFITDLEIGELNSIIVDCNDKCEFIIESELGYLILARREHSGISYYAPRSRTTTAIESLYDVPEFEKFLLNEKMIITVRGRKDMSIKFILRFD